MKPFIVLDTRKKRKDGRFHVKIKASIAVRINGKYKDKPRRAKTGVYLTEDEFTVMMGNRMGKVMEEKKDKVTAKLRKAEDICSIPGLTPEQYIRLMDGAGNFENVIGMFDYYIGVCLKEDSETGEARDGNAKALTNAKNFFLRFKGSEHISYAEITKDWLELCKQWAFTEKKNDKGKVIKQAIASSSFYMYCRGLRVILNLAHSPFNKITKESIPFGKKKEGKFPIPAASKKKRKVKLDLPLEKLLSERDKILSHASKRPAVNKFLNYWKTHYFANGANLADVLRWKLKDYNKERKEIVFERRKTALTEEDNEPITVFTEGPLEQLIQIEGNKSVNPDEYIFPVLNNSMNSAQRKQAVQDFTDSMNKRLKTARKEMGLEIKLSSGSGRYLASTILDRSGIPKSVIKDLLGHNSESMQGHYVSPYLVDLRKSVLKILAG